MMSRDVKEALPFLDENFRNQLLNTNLWIRDGETPGGKLKDILEPAYRNPPASAGG